jgi:hypothetical protein
LENFHPSHLGVAVDCGRVVALALEHLELTGLRHVYCGCIQFFAQRLSQELHAV